MKYQVVIVSMRQEMLRGLLNRIDFERTNLLGIVSVSNQSLRVNVEGDFAPNFTFSDIDALAEKYKDKEVYWLLTGQQDNIRNLGAMAKVLRGYGIDKKYIVNCEGEINTGWLGNMQYAEKTPLDFFATGISYMEVGLDTDVLENFGRGVNLAASSQDLKAGYQIAKKVIAHQKQLKFCLIGLTPYSFSYKMEDTFSTQGAAWQYKFYFEDFAEDDVFPKLLQKEYVEKAKGLYAENKPDINNLSVKRGAGLEFWLNGIVDIERELRDVTPKRNLDRVRENKEILASYVKLCREQHIMPVAVILPFSTMIQNRYDAEARKEFRMILEEYKKYHALEVIDLFDMELSNKYFYNATHLNQLGAKLVTTQIKEKLTMLLYKKPADYVQLLRQAKENCDVKGMAEYYIKYSEILYDAHSEGEEKKIVDSIHSLLCAGYLYLQEENFVKAAEYLNCWKNYTFKYGGVFWMGWYLMGARISYLTNNMEGVLHFLNQYLKTRGEDYEAETLLGNVYAKLGDREQSAEHYRKALKIWPENSIVKENLQKLEEDKLSEPLMPMVKMREINEENCYDIPIFINSRDRVGCLKKLVAWLLSHGYRNINILDNASTYEPLLEYYKDMSAQTNVNVIYSKKNLGHLALYCGFLKSLPEDMPFVYTDSDVVPMEDCPKDLLYRLYQLLMKYSFVDKVGMGLAKTAEIRDLEGAMKGESQYYQVQLEKDVYFGMVDTTFALYRPNRSYRIMSALRAMGNLKAHHTSWYLDSENLPEDEYYYMMHANSSSTMSTRIREGLSEK